LAGPTLLDLVARRIQDAMRVFLEGYFHISAIRSIENGADLSAAVPLDSHIRRNVGEDGQKSLDVLRWNSLGDEVIDLEKVVCSALEEILGVELNKEIFESELNRFTNLYLRGPQVPKQFSSGFHQLFPIIVQLGVMRPGELLSIENPEVHLHPDLQLKVSEFLLRQSRQGVGILVETHSDLIIRRVIRAMLEEEQGFSQQQFSLNFSSAHADPDFGTGSVLAPYGINVDGSIKWPEGFMDESIRESQRLMDVMYGRRPAPEGEGDE
jgi:hypothetical protein